MALLYIHIIHIFNIFPARLWIIKYIQGIYCCFLELNYNLHSSNILLCIKILLYNLVYLLQKLVCYFCKQSVNIITVLGGRLKNIFDIFWTFFGQTDRQTDRHFSILRTSFSTLLYFSLKYEYIDTSGHSVFYEIFCRSTFFNAKFAQKNALLVTPLLLHNIVQFLHLYPPKKVVNLTFLLQICFA